MKTNSRYQAAKLFLAVAFCSGVSMGRVLARDPGQAQAEDLWKRVLSESGSVLLMGDQRDVSVHIGAIQETRRQSLIDFVVIALSDPKFGRNSWPFGNPPGTEGEMRERDVAALVGAKVLAISDPKFVVSTQDSDTVREVKIQRLIKRAQGK
jgi:hypothetical protein